MIDYITKTNWAMDLESLKKLLDLSSSQNKEGAHYEPQKTTEHFDDIQEIKIIGPLFRYENPLTKFFGLSSYEGLTEQIITAVNDPSCKEIFLNIDSPGGEVNGCSELSKLIRSIREIKPITAYISGMGTSAAYWIASACDKIIASDTCLVGSIGVQSVIKTTSDKETLTFISSKTPNKNKDPTTKEGEKSVQKIVDDLCEVFISEVAQNRNVSKEKITEEYGKGEVFVAGEAIQRGLIDNISPHHSTLSLLKERLMKDKITLEVITKDYPEIAEALRNEGSSKIDIEKIKADERERIFQIEALGSHISAETLNKLRQNPLMTPEKAAIEILKAQKLEGLSHLKEIRAAEKEFDPPTPSGEPPEEEFDPRKTIEDAKHFGLID